MKQLDDGPPPRASSGHSGRLTWGDVPTEPYRRLKSPIVKCVRCGEWVLQRQDGELFEMDDDGTTRPHDHPDLHE